MGTGRGRSRGRSQGWPTGRTPPAWGRHGGGQEEERGRGGLEAAQGAELLRVRARHGEGRPRPHRGLVLLRRHGRGRREALQAGGDALAHPQRRQDRRPHRKVPQRGVETRQLFNKLKSHPFCGRYDFQRFPPQNLVGVEGFEPTTSSSQSWRTTRLCNTPQERMGNGFAGFAHKSGDILSVFRGFVKVFRKTFVDAGASATFLGF